MTTGKLDSTMVELRIIQLQIRMDLFRWFYTSMGEKRPIVREQSF